MTSLTQNAVTASSTLFLPFIYYSCCCLCNTRLRIIWFLLVFRFFYLCLPWSLPPLSWQPVLHLFRPCSWSQRITCHAGVQIPIKQEIINIPGTVLVCVAGVAGGKSSSKLLFAHPSQFNSKSACYTNTWPLHPYYFKNTPIILCTWKLSRFIYLLLPIPNLLKE